MKITDKRLEKAGFKLKEQPYETPDQLWIKDDIEIWDFNGEYWIVDVLDQGGIDVEFKTMVQLSFFFKACCREPLVCIGKEPTEKGL